MSSCTAGAVELPLLPSLSSATQYILTVLELVTPFTWGLQMKNRMDVAFDSVRTAGYRDVVVNLQLVGEDAQQLGVARHVCELQLILVPVFERKVRGRLLLDGQSNVLVLDWLVALSGVTSV